MFADLPTHHTGRGARGNCGVPPALQPRAPARGERLAAIGRRIRRSQTYQRSRRSQNGSTQTVSLETVHGQAFARKVGAQGSVDVDDEHDSISQAYAGQQVVLVVNAPEKVFGVWLKGRVIKSVPIKGLGGQEMSWEEYVACIKLQARSEERRLRGLTTPDAPALLGHLNAQEDVIQVR
jgi:hypothetical protein